MLHLILRMISKAGGGSIIEEFAKLPPLHTSTPKPCWPIYEPLSLLYSCRQLGILFLCWRFCIQKTGTSDKRIFVGIGIPGNLILVPGRRWHLRVINYHSRDDGFYSETPIVLPVRYTRHSDPVRILCDRHFQFLLDALPVLSQL